MRFLTAVLTSRHHVREWFEMKVAWLLPRGIAKWAMIRVVAHATIGKYGGDRIDDIGYKELHDRWEVHCASPRLRTRPASGQRQPRRLNMDHGFAADPLERVVTMVMNAYSKTRPAEESIVSFVTKTVRHWMEGTDLVVTSRVPTQDEIVERAKKALEPLMEQTKGRVRQASSLQQLAEIHREYQTQRDIILTPFIEMMHMLPLEPIRRSPEDLLHDIIGELQSETRHD